MQKVLEKYLDVLLKNANLTSEEELRLKNKILLAWVTNVGKRLLDIATDGEKIALNKIKEYVDNYDANSETATKLYKEYSTFLKENQETNIKVYKVYKEEAIRIVEKLLDVYIENVPPDKLNQIRKELKLIN